jgi:large subunit ribosomal protein L6
MKDKKKKELNEEIQFPDKVTVNIDKKVLILKSEKGEVRKLFPDKRIMLENNDSSIVLKAVSPKKTNKKLIKSYASHIRNMLKGSLEGHKYVLKICSGHFPMNISISNNELVVKNFLGEKIPRTLKLKGGASVTVEGDKIIVESTSKEIAGQVSADIEQLTRRTRFDPRIFQDGCYIISKDGKDVE